MLGSQERFQDRLDEIVSEEQLIGASVVSRDGIPVLSSFTPDLEQRAFSILVEGAMVAALMGSAEEGLGELGDDEVQHVTVEGGRLRMTVIDISEDLLFVGIGSADSDLESTLDPALQAADSLRALEESA